MTREEIQKFFAGVIVEGVTRKVIFSEYSEEGRIEVERLTPPQTGLPTVYLSFPAEEPSRCIVCGEDAGGKPACPGCWDEAIAQGLL